MIATRKDSCGRGGVIDGSYGTAESAISTGENINDAKNEKQK